MNVIPIHKPKERLTSLDVLRGLTVAAMILVNTPGNWQEVYAPLEHSKWNGCTPTDIVFPCFLFMAGISITFSLDSKRSDHSAQKDVLIKALRRMLLLIGFGLAIQLCYHFDFTHLRFPGVLQRIGLVYFIAVFLFLKLNDRMLSYLFVLLLISYYLLLLYVPTPEGTGNLDPGSNLAAYIDTLVFSPQHLYRFAKTDPCGLLGTLPSTASTLSGILVGRRIKRPDQTKDKLKWLLAAGTISIAAGLLWAIVFPLNKALWTSSYVLYTSGICTLCLTIFYYIIDIKGHKSYTWIFIVFGSNALAAYILSEVLPALIDLFKYHSVTQTVQGMKLFYILYSNLFIPKIASLLSALTFTILIWLIMLVFYKRKIIIKI
jgi:predicted acyltransferase